MNTQAVGWRRALQLPSVLGLSRGADSPTALVLLMCAWTATAGNVALWRELGRLSALHGGSGVLLALGLGCALAGAVAVILSAFAWRLTLKPAVMVMLLVSAACTHFMLSFGMVMDPGMLVNVLQTDVHEAADLWSWRLFADVTLLGALPALWVWRRPLGFGPWPRRALANLKIAVGGLLLAVLSLLASFQPLASTMRNHKEVRYLLNPLNLLWAAGHTAFAGPPRLQAITPIGLDATLGHRFDGGAPPLLVLVLGETGRAGNFGLNGYARDTTPVLSREDVASFRNVWSCGTSTAMSVPCMFSRLPRTKYFDRDHDEEGLLDVLQRAGYAVLWLDNQAGCKGVCDRVPHVTTDTSRCPDGECLDGVMLDGLDARIAQLPAARRARGVVLVMHQMGSHGPAYSRRSSPETKRFLPECTQHELQACSRNELVNAYDNSIAYTDRMLGDTLRWLKERDAQWRSAMVYVADHGESLGENNLYLHGLPYAVAPDVQKRVPWITWLSPRFAKATEVTGDCLRSQLGAPLSHDHYFHSVLGLMDVHSAVYEPALDAYAPCRDPR